MRPPETERDFLRAVVELAHLYGWRVFHPLPATNRRGKWATHTQGDTGFPDLVLCRPPRLIFAELKTQRGRLRPAQQAWLHALSQCPSVETYLWRPSDWQTIVRTLQRD